MAVYVDTLIDYGWKLGPSCHLTADSLEELHEFAKRLGLKRSWFQISNQELAHYDLTKNKRALAVSYGAITVEGWKNISDHFKRLKERYSRDADLD